MISQVPALEKAPWPTLGPLVCDWIEQHLVFGPGDLRGEPARLDAEKRALIYRAYEIHPRGSKYAGRRRFRRVALSLRKGSAKTELAAWIAAAELHPDAPVRCVGWDRKGAPVGGGVRDPYIPMVAYSEEQTEDLAYGALRVILEESEVAADFDIGLERIMRVKGDGKAVPLASAPGARDGARTTFQHFDETHRFVLAKLKAAHRTMLANLPKRRLADAWALETTTAYAPGELSVAEETAAYARAVAEGKQRDPKLFFFHRAASDDHDLTTRKGLVAAIKEASGPVAEWSDVQGIADQWEDPTADRAFLERVWLNRIVRASARAFDLTRWGPLARPGVPESGRVIVLGFDGSRYNDATGLVGCDVATGHLFTLGGWEKPDPAPHDWEVPEDEVRATVTEAFERWSVWRLYADPPYWETVVNGWAGEYGAERVIQWRTNHWRKMANACRAFANAIQAGEVTHDGNAILARHLGNAHRMQLQMREEDGSPSWVITKEQKNSPNKIDLAVAAVLAWQARCDAMAEGMTHTKESRYDGDDDPRVLDLAELERREREEGAP